MVSVNSSVGSVQSPQKISVNEVTKQVVAQPTTQTKGLDAMPQKRDIVSIGKVYYGPDGGPHDFIKHVSSDILIAKEETEINILKDKIKASDTTDAQKTILEEMLKDAQGRFEKLKKEQGVK